jgi:hypothetical protein
MSTHPATFLSRPIKKLIIQTHSEAGRFDFLQNTDHHSTFDFSRPGQVIALRFFCFTVFFDRIIL